MAEQGSSSMLNMQSASALYNNFKRLAGPPNLYQVKDQAGTNASMFPMQIGSTNPQDDMRGLQAQMVGKDGIVPGVGLSVLDDGYWNYAQEKKQEAMGFEFENYILSQVDLSTPESSAWWFQNFPEIRTLKFAEIDRQAEIQKSLAKIAIAGPQSREDFQILFLKQNNLLGDQNVPLTRLNEGTGYAKDFKSGMFSVFSRPQNTILTSQKNQGDATGFAPTGEGSNRQGKRSYVFDWSNPIGSLGTAKPNTVPSLGGQKTEFGKLMNFGVTPAGG